MLASHVPSDQQYEIKIKRGDALEAGIRCGE
jgi:hypothetical protein